MHGRCARRKKDLEMRKPDSRNGTGMAPAYTHTAEVYDAMVGTYAFDMWRENFERLKRIYNIDTSRVADIACGTGLASRYLAARGSEVWACDISQQMLRVALRAGDTGQHPDNIRFFRQDMTRLSLPRRVTLLICATDALNHLLREEDVSKALSAFRAALLKGGHALFDLNTLWQLREGCDEEEWNFKVEGRNMRWRSRWDEASETATLFMEFEGDKGQSLVEIHRERGYEAEFIAKEALRNGFKGIDAYDARGLAKPSHRTRRMQFVAWA